MGEAAGMLDGVALERNSVNVLAMAEDLLAGSLAGDVIVGWLWPGCLTSWLEA